MTAVGGAAVAAAGPKPVVVVVGLGPGAADHVTVETRASIGRIAHRFLRTRRHPAAALVGAATDFDHLPHGGGPDDGYTNIVDALARSAADHGEVLYAVPGSPLVLEASVRALLADDRVRCEIRPAMSFLDVAWARLGIDPVGAGVRLVDANGFAATVASGDAGPFLVAHAHDRPALAEITAAMGEGTGAVVALQRLGTPEELVTETTWGELDAAVEPDDLTCLYVPRLDEPVGAGYVRFHRLARTLREQCPWDREQTHASLVPYLVEETFELVDALRALDPDDPATEQAVIEELGDVLYQIEFHATIAEQAGRYSIADVTTAVHDKLVRRHPHVFGDVAAPDAGTVIANWEDIKRAEKGRTSVFDGVAASLPSLAYTQRLMGKAAKVGFDWPDVSGPLAKVDEELAELREAMEGGDDRRIADELGDVFGSLVSVARHLGVDAELATRATAAKFRRRFEAVEALATARRIELRTAGLVPLDALWNDVKRSET